LPTWTATDRRGRDTVSKSARYLDTKRRAENATGV
jgi:hypothetical protein